MAQKRSRKLSRSLESEPASIAVILGGLAVVASSIIGSSALADPPAADATPAIELVSTLHGAGSPASTPIGETVTYRETTPDVVTADERARTATRNSEWWWGPVGLAAVAAVASVLRKPLRRREARVNSAEPAAASAPLSAAVAVAADR